MINEGSKFVEQILHEWTQRCATVERDDEDVIMDGDEEEERSIAILKDCIAKYQDQIETNPWIQALIASL